MKIGQAFGINGFYQKWCTDKVSAFVICGVKIDITIAIIGPVLSHTRFQKLKSGRIGTFNYVILKNTWFLSLAMLETRGWMISKVSVSHSTWVRYPQ
jgi:hypothetical protein